MKYLKLCLLNMLLIPAIVVAHGPSRQKVVQEIEINASADKIWKIIERERIKRFQFKRNFL